MKLKALVVSAFVISGLVLFLCFFALPWYLNGQLAWLGGPDGRLNGWPLCPVSGPEVAACTGSYWTTETAAGINATPPWLREQPTATATP